MMTGNAKRRKYSTNDAFVQQLHVTNEQTHCLEPLTLGLPLVKHMRTIHAYGKDRRVFEQIFILFVSL